MRVGPTTRLLPMAIKYTTNKDNIRKGATMQPIIINQQYPTRKCTIHHIQNKIKQFILDPRALHAPGLALLRVKLLKTYGLWTSRNLLLDLLLLQDEPTDVESYMQ
jgi:hypothetical protein